MGNKQAQNANIRDQNLNQNSKFKNQLILNFK